MKKIEIKTPKYETVQVGEFVIERWETSDGKQFDDEEQADYHEFHHCKLKHRGLNLPVEQVAIMDFSCIEDVIRYENDHIYSGCIKKYHTSEMTFPNTYVLYNERVHKFEYDDRDYYGYNEPDTYIYLVTLDEYKRLLLDGIENLK